MYFFYVVLVLHNMLGTKKAVINAMTASLKIQ